MAQAQSTTRSIQTPVLDIAYEEHGGAQGFPIVLLHGFPDDVRAFDQVAPPLAKAGYRVLVPYLRGYGPTRFRDASAPRMASSTVREMRTPGARLAAVSGKNSGGPHSVI